MIPRLEIRQENLSIDRVTKHFLEFVEMVGDSRPCDDFVLTLTQK